MRVCCVLLNDGAAGWEQTCNTSHKPDTGVTWHQATGCVQCQTWVRGGVSPLCHLYGCMTNTYISQIFLSFTHNTWKILLAPRETRAMLAVLQYTTCISMRHLWTAKHLLRQGQMAGVHLGVSRDSSLLHSQVIECATTNLPNPVMLVRRQTHRQSSLTLLRMEQNSTRRDL